MKKKIWKVIFGLIICVLCCLGVCGCSSEGKKVNSDILNEKIYFEKIKMGISQKCIPMEKGILLSERYAFFVEEKPAGGKDSYEEDYIFYRQELEKAEELPTELIKIHGNALLGFEITQENGDGLLSVFYNNEDQYFIEEFDYNGSCIRRITVKNPEIDGWFSVFGLTRIDKDTYLAYNNEGLYRIDDQGEVQEYPFKDQVESAGNISQCRNGVVYFSYLDTAHQWMLGTINVNTMELTGAVQTAQFMEFRSHGNGIYFKDGSKFMEIEENANSFSQLFDLTNIGETGGKFKDFECVNGEWYAVSQEEGDVNQSVFLYHFFNISDEKAEQYNPEKLYSGKVNIKIYDSMGVIELDPLSEIIENYNEQSDKYFVEIIKNEKEYGDAELISNDSPDLLFTYLSSEIDRFQKNGYLIDLVPMCKNIEANDIHELAFREFGQDGRLYAVPTNIYASTVICMGDNLPDNSGWTVDEFLTWIENNHTIYNDGWLDQVGILEIVLNGSLDEYVDFTKKEVHFEDNDFKKMAKRIKELSFESEDFFQMDDLSQGAILRTSGTGMAKSLAEDEFLAKRKYHIMGFPNSERIAKGSLLYVPGLAIFEKSENKEEAMDFIEYVLSYRKDELVRSGANGEHTYGQVWALKSLTDMDLSLSIGTHAIYVDNEAIDYECTEEHVGKVKKIVEEACPSHDLEYSVMLKVLEEMITYFEGERSLDAVCDYLQDTVTIMINE